VRIQDWVFISLTHKGLELCKSISEKLGGGHDILTIEKRKTEYTINFETFNEVVEHAFLKSKTLVFVTATGIVVRSIKDYIIDKTVDPAVLVLDENGEYCISLLSGHLGGANEKARKIEQLIGAKPVITTASDVSGKMAVDTIAMKLECHIDDLKKAKDVTAMIVNGKRVMIDYDGKENFGLIKDNIDNVHLYDGAIYISEKKLDNMVDNIAVLNPKNIVIGMGCRRGTETEKVLELIRAELKAHNINENSVNKIVSVSIKKDETCFIEGAKILGGKFETISRSRIVKIQHLFDGSSFVEETIGVRAVSEPCGYIGSYHGEQVGQLRRKDGMTISLWKIRG